MSMQKNLQIFTYTFGTFCATLLTIFWIAFSKYDFLNIFFLTFAGSIFFHIVIRKKNLFMINSTILGIIFGWILGKCICSIVDTLIPTTWQTNSIHLITHSSIFLISVYISMVLCMHTVKNILEGTFFQKSIRKKNILLDKSIFTDPRIIDLAASGLLDTQILLPNFIIDFWKKEEQSLDSQIAKAAKQALITYKKLSQIPHINIRIITQDHAAIDSKQQLLSLAQSTYSNILTAELIPQKNFQFDKEVRIISIHNIAKALKSTATAGEHLQVSIQRLGKEPTQGIGYLEDGTMIVVNNCAEHLGKTITVLVLWVKHTTSGRIIFCNPIEKKQEETTYSKENSLFI